MSEGVQIKCCETSEERVIKGPEVAKESRKGLWGMMIELICEHNGQGTNVKGRVLGAERPARRKAEVILNFKHGHNLLCICLRVSRPFHDPF